MITLKRGNIFESKMQTIVNPVNCVGVMGAGLALAYKNKYPDMFSFYKKACQEKRLLPGKPIFYWETSQKKGILLFPTKNHWRDLSKTEYIEDGLDYFVSAYRQWDVSSIAFPALGCGYGGLTWNMVGNLMIEKLSNIGIPVEIYLPTSA